MCCERRICAVKGKFVPWTANLFIVGGEYVSSEANLCHGRRLCVVRGWIVPLKASTFAMEANM